MEKKFWWWMGIALALALLGTLGYRELKWRLVGMHLEEEVAKAKAYGIPFTATELVPPSELAESDNAAPLIAQAGRLFTLDARAKKAMSELDRLMKAGTVDQAEFAKNLAVLEPELKLAHEAAGKKGAVYARDYDLGMNLLFPELAQSKTLVKALCARAELEAARGRISEALVSLRDARQIAEMSGAEPVLIGMLVAIAEHAMVARAVERCYSVAFKVPGAIGSLTGVEREEVKLPSLWQAMRGEAYMQIATIRNFEMFGGDSLLSQVSNSEEPPSLPPINPAKLQRSGLPAGSRERAFLTRTLQHWNRAIAKAGMDRDGLALCEALDKEGLAVSDSQDPTEQIAKVVFPVFLEAGQVLDHQRDVQGVTVALGKVLQFRQSYGIWPASLAEARATANDPYGAPLRMSIHGGSVIVYSVGPNGIDDGGENDYSSDHKRDDVSAYFPASARPQRL